MLDINEVEFDYGGHGYETVAAAGAHWYADLKNDTDRPEQFWDRWALSEDDSFGYVDPTILIPYARPRQRSFWEVYWDDRF